MIRRLSLFWKRFTPLEVRLFAEVRNVLPKDAQRLFDAQVAAINHVQRLPPSWYSGDGTIPLSGPTSVQIRR